MRAGDKVVFLCDFDGALLKQFSPRSLEDVRSKSDA